MKGDEQRTFHTLEWWLMYPTEFDQMHIALRRWVALTELQWQTLAAIFRVRKFESHEHLLQPGSSGVDPI